MKPTIFFDTCHMSNIGGGENYLMRFATALNKFADVYFPQQFHSDFLKYNGFYSTFKEYNWMFTPDIHIQCNYNFINKGIGKKNVILTFFPKQDLALQVRDSGITDIVTICAYSAIYVKEFWNINRSVCIYPVIDTSSYKNNLEKENQIVSIGHFFQEEDGHSKNQHILIEAFRKFSESRPDWKLVLIGNVNNQKDAEYVNRLYIDSMDLNVELHANAPDEVVKEELGKSKMLWHANGYNRTNPAQTEHFGIIVLEALASNCVPLVHASGGARDIEFTASYDSIDSLVDFSLTVADVLDGGKADYRNFFPEKYTLPYFERTIEQWLNTLL